MYILHVDRGPVWQLLSVHVAPELSPRWVGEVLINHALAVARGTSGVQKVVAVMQRELRTQSGRLELHSAGGAKATAAFLPGWRPRECMVESKAATAEPGWQLEDVDNEGAVLLIEYDLAAFRLVHDRHPDRPVQPSPLPNGEGQHANEIGIQAESVRQVQRGVTKVVQSFLSADVSADTALMDAGLTDDRLAHAGVVMSHDHGAP